MRVGGDVCNFVIKCDDCNIISGLSKNLNWVLELSLIIVIYMIMIIWHCSIFYSNLFCVYIL